jgi:tetratricopeptide (TPR) repeat protein
MRDDVSDHGSQNRIIGELLRQKKWEEMRQLALEWLQEEPTSHWLLAQISQAYYEERNYLEALEYSKRALDIQPSCPLALWDYAGALDMLERNDEALAVYRRLMRRGAARIAHGRCGEGIRWARSLVNDCRYRVGLIYGRVGEARTARSYIRRHLSGRGRNTPSIYSLKEVTAHLDRVALARGDGSTASGA